MIIYFVINHNSFILFALLLSFVLNCFVRQASTKSHYCLVTLKTILLPKRRKHVLNFQSDNFEYFNQNRSDPGHSQSGCLNRRLDLSQRLWICSIWGDLEVQCRFGSIVRATTLGTGNSVVWPIRWAMNLVFLLMMLVWCLYWCYMFSLWLPRSFLTSLFPFLLVGLPGFDCRFKSTPFWCATGMKMHCGSLYWESIL